MTAIDLLNKNNYSRTIHEYNTQEKGTLSKEWYSIDKIVVLVKSNSAGCYEPISEVLASNMAEVLGIEHVSYKLGLLEDFSKSVKSPDNYKYVSMCQRYYCREGYTICSMYDYIMEYLKYNLMDDRHTSDKDILAFIERLDEENKFRFFSMIQFDAIICNIDGHRNNIELFVNGDGSNIKIAPIYDRGQSILHNDDAKSEYTFDTARTLRATHESQIRFIQSLGFSNSFGEPNEIYKRWVDMSEDVFDKMSRTRVAVIKDFIKRRIELYAEI